MDLRYDYTESIRKEAGIGSGILKLLSGGKRALVGTGNFFKKIHNIPGVPVVEKIGIGLPVTYGLLKTDYTQDLLKDVGRSAVEPLATGATEVLKGKVGPAIDDMGNKVSVAFKPNKDSYKPFVEQIAKVREHINAAVEDTGERGGKGIAKVLAPSVHMLGVSGISGGLGGIAAYSIARRLTKNRLLRTLATLAGAGVGALGGMELNSRVLEPYVWGTGGKSKTTASGKDDKNTSNDTDKSNQNPDEKKTSSSAKDDK